MRENRLHGSEGGEGESPFRPLSERCMFESNFPPDKVSFSYNVMYNAFKRLSRAYSPSERAALFHDTAVKVYRIDV